VAYRRRKHLFSRRTRRRLAGAVIAMALVAGLAQAGASVGHPSSGSAPVQAAIAPGAGGNPGGGSAAWARALLNAIPEPQTQCNLAAIEAWEAAEGGGVTNNASYNPLNTTQPEPGSWAVNDKNVQAFPTAAEGLQANVTVITNGLYGGILSALQQGNNAQNVANAVADSPWGTSQFSASC
jgi:hypothetical protein